MAFSNYKEAADKLRTFIKDHEHLNVLEQERENTDDDLIDYIKDALNDINVNYSPKTTYTLTDVIVEPGEDGNIPWNTVKLGATIQALISNGILSARNMLTYSDAGGITVTNMDKWGRYMNLYNLLINKYLRNVQQLKVIVNIEMGYGGVSSPLGLEDDYTYVTGI